MGENVKFLSNNMITGLSRLSASSGTATLVNVIDRDLDTAWTSLGEGTTQGTITWTPAVSTTIDRFFIQNHNLGTYSLYYNEGTGNVFSPDISVTGNAGTNNYHEFTGQAITSVSLAMQVSSGEKSIGQIFFGTQQFEVDNNPAEYNPIKRKKGHDVEMADGGAKSIWLGEKFYADLHFSFVSTTERANFDNLYDAHDSFYFMPTPTVGTWDGNAWNCNWVGNKDIMKLTGGVSKDVGYDVSMMIWEIAG